MADVILSVGGQIIGGAIGGPIGAAIGGAIGGAIGQTFTPTQKFQGPRLGDLRVTGTEYGQPIPWTAASPRISGQIIWASPKREIANTQKQGKGGGGGSQSTTYTYEVDVAYLLSENPIIDVSRIWINGELVGTKDGRLPTGNWFIDGVLELTGQIGNGKFAELRVYTGADDQMPDSIIEAVVGVGNTPAYRGRGYCVIKSLQLGSSGQLPNITFELGNPGTGADFCITPTALSFPGVTGEVVNKTDTTFITAENISGVLSGGFFTGTVRKRVYSNVDGSLISTTDTTATMAQGPAVVVSQFVYGAVLNSDFLFIARNASPFPLSVSINSGAPVALTGNTAAIDSRCSFAANCFWFTDVNGDAFKIDGSAVFRYAKPADATFRDAVFITDPDTQRTVFRYEQTSPTSTYVIAEISTVGANPLSRLWQREINLGVILGKGLIAMQGNRLVYSSEQGFDALDTGLAVRSYRLLEGDQYELCGKVNFFGGVFDLYPTSPIGDGKVWVQGIGAYDVGAAIPALPGTQNTEGLAEVTEKIMLRAGYTSGQFDADPLTNDVRIRGLALSQVSAARSALELLQGAYFFEAAKTDTIDLFPRQSTPVVTIPYADLGFSFDGGDQEQFVLTNSNDLELPAQIAVQYANTLADYQAGTEFSDRILTEQESTNVVQLALGLLPVEAKTIADKMIADLIAGQWRFTIKLPLKYAYLMPGDIFNVIARDGRSFRGRIQSKKDSQVLIELECVLDSVGTLDVDAATDANYVSQTVILDPSVTEWESLDIPLLRDADNNVSWYSAMGPVLVEDTRWPGGVIVQSFGGDAYTQLYSTGDVSAIGECDTVLGDWPHGAMFDETNKLTVTLYAGELESVARADMLLDQELNAAAVGVDGQWEIIRFRNAELTGQTSTGLNIYELSGLLRGQRGTEWAIGLHSADERFVLLDTTIRNIPSQLNELNLERFIKGVTSNTPLNDVTERSFTHTGVSLKPFSVAQLRALPDGSDIEVTWNRRTRLSYRYAGINPVVPLGEATEAYRVWIYDGSTLVRTENVTTDSYTYSAADIASDGFVSTDTIRIEVAQVSAIVGAGYIEEVEVIAP
jgi:hypothetical protein